MAAYLETEAIEASYGKLKVLRGVSIEASKGQVALIIGRNGSGKSTVLKSVFGLTPLDRGRVLLNGVDLSNARPHQKVRHGIALVPQASNQGRGIFQSLTVEENLRLGAFTVGGGALERGRSQVFDLFPILRERQYLKAGLLSGGQQQMLAVSLALMSGPRALMLDEPTSGLALGAAQELMRTIRRVATELDVAVVLVEQNIKLALEYADWVYALRGGTVVRQGPPAAIFDGVDLLDIL